MDEVCALAHAGRDTPPCQVPREASPGPAVADRFTAIELDGNSRRVSGGNA